MRSDAFVFFGPVSLPAFEGQKTQDGGRCGVVIVDKNYGVESPLEGLILLQQRKGENMRTRSNSVVRLDWFHRLVTRTILDFQVSQRNLPDFICCNVQNQTSSVGHTTCQLNNRRRKYNY